MIMNTKKSNVTVFIEVFNEEHRIEACLKSFSWADEIFVFDKNSSDKTRQIAEKYATVVTVPFCEASENAVNNISNHGSTEWCLIPTASSLMHPKLASEIVKLTSDPNFEYDVIGMPYGMHSLGVNNKRSPFYAEHKFTLIRRSALVLSTKLHHEISFNSKRIFKMPKTAPDALLYHCTHPTQEAFMIQTARYAKYEAKNDLTLTKKKAFFDLLKAFAIIILKRKSFLLGWTGAAVALNYLIYFAARFVFVWERDRPNNDQVYPELRDKISALWDEQLKARDDNN
jgi:(heptosyl)LPS beta-1,4-glucosyltransferase